MYYAQQQLCPLPALGIWYNKETLIMEELLMNRLLDMDSTLSFTAYSLPHIIALLILIGLAVLLYRYRVPLRDESHGNWVRYGLLALLALSEITLNMWYVTQNRYDVKDTLPFELCTISLYISIFMLLLKSRGLFQIVYFIGIGGALQALLTPALSYGFPHYRFIEFFVAHMAIILTVLYMVWVEQYRPTLRSVMITMLFLNILLLVVGTINKLTGGNYMFLSRKPETASLLDVLGPYPWYLLSLELVALFIFLLLYLPFAILKHLHHKQKQARNSMYRT